MKYHTVRRRVQRPLFLTVLQQSMLCKPLLPPPPPPPPWGIPTQRNMAMAAIAYPEPQLLRLTYTYLAYEYRILRTWELRDNEYNFKVCVSNVHRVQLYAKFIYMNDQFSLGNLSMQRLILFVQDMYFPNMFLLFGSIFS